MIKSNNKFMQEFTVEEFQKRFDELLGRVEKGEHIRIVNEKGQKAIMISVDNEVIKVYTELNKEIL